MVARSMLMTDVGDRFLFLSNKIIFVTNITFGTFGTFDSAILFKTDQTSL